MRDNSNESWENEDQRTIHRSESERSKDKAEISVDKKAVRCEQGPKSNKGGRVTIRDWYIIGVRVKDQSNFRRGKWEIRAPYL